MVDSVWRRGGLFGVAAGLLSLVAGCLSPTLPMPPPGEPSEYEIGVDRQSLTVLGQGVTPGAWVTVLNATINLGSIVRAGDDGHYRASLPADLLNHRRNLLKVWQQVHNENSDMTEFLVPPDCFFWNAPDGEPSPSVGVTLSYTCRDSRFPNLDAASSGDD